MLAIVDAHHHLWEAGGAPAGHGGESYTAPQLLVDAREQHLLASVFVECGAMYGSAGPRALRAAAETAFAARSGTAVREAAQAPALCAGIVAAADLTDSATLDAVLDAHERAAGGRLRGVRHTGAWDPSPSIPNGRVDPPPHLYRGAEFRRGFGRLAARGLSFDAWVYHPQLDDVADLAASHPDTVIIVNHCGGPLGAGPYSRSPQTAFAQWRRGIRALAKQPNVVMKIGGLGMRIGPLAGQPPITDPGTLADAIGPFVRTCLEAFGADRAMFESNFPVDRPAYGYATIWAAFERLVRDASEEEREKLFSGTANRVYRLGIRGSR